MGTLTLSWAARKCCSHFGKQFSGFLQSYTGTYHDMVILLQGYLFTQEK